jgi:hypothetical protein
MATQNKRKLGPRATVAFKSGQGQGRGAKTQYVYMLRSVAEKLGFKIVTDATVTRKAPKGSKAKEIKLPVRGSSGAKRIKVPLPDTNSRTANSKGAATKYLSVPVPANATITDIKKFLGNASKKPESFVSPDGRTYSLAKGK